LARLENNDNQLERVFMKYAAFKLIGDPSQTRVGSISADGKSVNEYELGVDLSESGVVEILRLELAGKLPSQASATHPMSAIQLVAPIPRPRRNIFCVGKNYFDHAKEFGTSGYDSSTSKPGDEIPKKRLLGQMKKSLFHKKFQWILIMKLSSPLLSVRVARASPRPMQ
jgi:hypothetical protein